MSSRFICKRRSVRSVELRETQTDSMSESPNWFSKIICQIVTVLRHGLANQIGKYSSKTNKSYSHNSLEATKKNYEHCS